LAEYQNGVTANGRANLSTNRAQRRVTSLMRHTMFEK